MARKSESKVRSFWDRKRVLTENSGELITEQSHAASCDLHLILNRYKSTGELPLGNSRGEPQFMECPDEEYDFKYMMDTMKRAESEYYNLPEEEQAKYRTPSDWLRDVLTAEPPEADDDPQSESHSSPADSEASAEGGEAPSEASQNV